MPSHAPLRRNLLALLVCASLPSLAAAETTPATDAQSATTLDSISVIGRGEARQVQRVTAEDMKILPPGANPLKLLAGLHGGLLRLGGSIRHRARVERIEMAGSDFRLVLDGAALTAPRIVIAAGLGSARLGRQVGLDVPVHPERGQILVTERLAPFLPLPASGLRQTAEGTVMIGATKDEVGLDVSTTTEAAASLSAKTVRTIPALATARLVRQWAGLRVMTPDSYPIYAQSESHPGAFVALCHSGVTLAAFHAEVLAEAVADGTLPESFSPFHQRRFDVPKAA